MKKGKHIGLVLFDFPPYSETFFVNMIRVLTENGYRVTVFANQSSKSFVFGDEIEFKRNNVKLFEYDILYLLFNALMALVFSSKSMCRLYLLNKKDGYSIKNNIKSVFYASFLLRHKLDYINYGFANIAFGLENLSIAMKCKSVISMRGFDISIYPLKHEKNYKRIFSKMDYIHTISEDLVQRAYLLGLDKFKPYHLITPAIDIQKFKLNNNLKIHQPLNKEKLSITTVGRLHWIKNYKDILKALQIFKKSQNLKFTFNIVGGGEDLESLKFLTYEYNLSEEIIFHGVLRDTEIVELLELSDVYIQYSLHEGFCNSLLEAQCMGCIAIASNVGGLPENVLDGFTGYLVESHRPDLLADLLAEIIHLSDVELMEIRKNAILRIQNDFNLTKQGKEFLELFSS